MHISLAYGNKKFTFLFKDSSEVLKTKEPELKITKETFINNLKVQLKNRHKDFKKTAIIVSDKTRLCDYPTYLPLLINTLLNEGTKKEDITFYIAYGTHTKQTDIESVKNYGKIFKEYTFIHHNCDDTKNFTSFGKTKRGTPILIRKDIYNSSLIITFGSISHHYFAGFGGGRKLLFPGLGERKSIYHNHSLILNNKERRLESRCKEGVLNENPIAEDLEEIDTFTPSKLSIYGILNSKGEVRQIHFGKTYKDFTSVCKEYDSYFKSQINKQFDMVIASSGGYPKDINFIQVHKSIHYASAFVKDNGTLIMLSECRDGMGNDSFLKFFKQEGNTKNLFEELSNNYEGNGGTALSLKEKSKRINIHMLTQLSEEICHRIGIKKVDINEIRDLIEQEKGTIAVIKNSSMLIK